ncbi:MAG TPA: DUF3078 domain-containing protein [Candidatus Marinimicrobia bacterium]|nr:DUF3078 domain-containing protein [Candidatus Neomarinimicrobiota bacterium]
MKNQLIAGLICALLIAASAEEQPIGRQKSVVGNFGTTQTSFDNWTAGGESTFAWQINMSAKFVNNQQKWNWTNTGKLAFGKSRIGDQAARKSADEIKLESVYTYKLGIPVNPYAAVKGETQFAYGYKYTDTSAVKISNFMDPGYFTESIGLGYSPSEQLTTRLGFALKQTVTRDFPVPYSDDPETDDELETFKNEAGLESATDFSQKFRDNLLFTSNLVIFSNLQAINQVDVKWDNVFTASITKYVNVTFNFKLFYDHDLSVRRQIMQTLSLGLTYTFI